MKGGITYVTGIARHGCYLQKLKQAASRKETKPLKKKKQRQWGQEQKQAKRAGQGAAQVEEKKYRGSSNSIMMSDILQTHQNQGRLLIEILWITL